MPPPTADPRIQHLLDDLGSEIEDVRKAAVAALGGMGDPALLPHLERLVDDPSPAVQYFARRAVDDLRKRMPRATAKIPALQVATVCEMLLGEDPARRMLAARTCLTVKSTELLQALLKALETERDVKIIATLTQALGTYRDARVTAKLLELLRHSSARVRSNSIDAAMLLDDPAILDAVSLLATDAANRVRGSVALFLASRDPAQAQGIVREMIESDLLWMKDTAIFVLHAAGAPWCVPFLEALIQRTGEDPALIEKAALALRQLRLRLGPQLATIAAAPAPAPAAAAEAVASPAPAAAQAAVLDRVTLLSKMNDPTAEVRLDALNRLAAFEDDDAEERVQLAGMDVDPAVRTRAHILSLQIELRRLARAQFMRLGTAALTAERLPEGCTDALARLRALSAQIDRGHRLTETLRERDRTMADLGRLVLAAYSGNALEPGTLTELCAEVQATISTARQNAKAARLQAGDSSTSVASISASDIPAELRKESGPIRATRKEKFIPAPAARATRKIEAIAAPPPPGLSGLARTYGILLVPLVVAIGVVGLIAGSMRSRIDAVVKKIPPAPVAAPVTTSSTTMQPRDVIGAKDAAGLLNKVVRWEGKVVESDPAQTRLVVNSIDGVQFVAEFERPVEKRIVGGTKVSIDGTIQTVKGGLSLKGRRAIRIHQTAMQIQQEKIIEERRSPR